MMPGIEKGCFDSVPRLQAMCLLNLHQDFSLSLFFWRVSPVIRARLEQFDFPLCASKPGCELSKAASKAAAKTRRGGDLKPVSSGAPRLKGMLDGRGFYGCLEIMETWVVMGIDKATHVREGQSGVLAQEGHDVRGC